MNHDPSEIVRVLESLEHVEPANSRVLSVYLDTSSDRVPGQAYLIAFRDSCRAVAAEIPHEEHSRFGEARNKIEQYLLHSFQAGPPGVAIFASGEDDYFHPVVLPVATGNSAAWDSAPHIEPIYRLLDNYERVAVALFDKERTRLFTLFLGEIESKREFTDVVPGKHKQGGWSAGGEGRFAPHTEALPPGRPGWGTGWAQSGIERHHDEHVRQHAKRTAEALVDTRQQYPFDRLLIGGTEEAISVLRQELPDSLAASVAGTFRVEMIASDSDIVAMVSGVAESAERDAENQAIDELFERLTAGGVVGAESTLDALIDRRVYRLFLTDEFGHSGHVCRTCGRLSVQPLRCPRCEQSVEPLESLRRHMLRQALDQGAMVDFVAGEAADRLNEAGGVGAWTRW